MNLSNNIQHLLCEKLNLEIVTRDVPFYANMYERVSSIPSGKKLYFPLMRLICVNIHAEIRDNSFIYKNQYIYDTLK